MGSYTDGQIAVLQAEITDNDPNSETFGDLIDPTTLEIAWALTEGGEVTIQTWADDQIVHVDTGKFAFYFDTTGSSLGTTGITITFTWKSTGTGQGSQTQSIYVAPDPYYTSD